MEWMASAAAAAVVVATRQHHHRGDGVYVSAYICKI